MTGFPPREEDAGYTLYQFKKRFGCSLEYLTGYYDLVFKPGLYRAARLGEVRVLPFAYRIRARLNRRFAHTPTERTPDDLTTS